MSEVEELRATIAAQQKHIEALEEAMRLICVKLGPHGFDAADWAKMSKIGFPPRN